MSRYNFSVVSVWKILTVRKILRFCSDNARWESVVVHKHGAGVKFPENCKDWNSNCIVWLFRFLHKNGVCIFQQQAVGIPDNCYGHHGRCPCKIILSGVKFSRLSTKTAYILLFRDIFQCFGVFLVNFWVSNLKLENVACVKEITNIRYGVTSI